MRTLLIDFDLDQPPDEPLLLPGPRRVRAVVWRGAEPLGQITLQATTAIEPELVKSEAARQLGASISRPRPRPSRRPTLPAITVAIPTRNRPADLAVCLDFLRMQTGPSPHEVIVVDNAPSNAETKNLVEGREGVRYVVEHVQGASFARNRALAEATGEIVAFVDDDTRPPPGWLHSVAVVFALAPEVGVCSGPVVPAELETEAQELFERRGGFTQTFERLVLDRDAPGRPLLVGALACGCNLAVRKDALRRLGGFDVALGAGTPAVGGEDYDVVYRMLAAGHLFAYEPSTLLRHRHRRDRRALARQMESWGRGTVAFLMKCRQSGEAPRIDVWRTIAWLFAYEVRRLVASLRPGSADRFPVSLVLVEIGGCIRGLWAYRRSRRYVREVTRAAGRGQSP